MTDAEDFDDLHSEPGAIGVGMGGSCPVCRAPVDLGQEFCLECGSPIRFTPRQRRQQRGRPADAARTAAAPAAMPPKSGFPWIPFLVVLALIGGGVAFALVEGGDPKKSGSSSSVEDPLPSIDSTQAETTSDTETTTVDDCSSVVSPLDETQPAVAGVDPTTGQPGDPSLVDGTETIPQVDDGTVQDGSGDAFQDPSVPSTNGDTSEEAVTVDRNGNLCAGDAASEDPATTDPFATDPGTSTTPASTTPTSTTPASTTPATTTSGTWPAGKEGWTVVVDGYNTAERATQRAADVQADGFADSGTLFSSDFTSLCPGIHVVYSGVFTKKSEAEARMRELSNKDYAGMYVREIKRSGSAATGCGGSSRPQN